MEEHNPLSMGDLSERRTNGQERIRRCSRLVYLALLPLLTALSALFLWPICKVVISSITETGGFGLANYQAVLTDATFWKFAANTLRIAAFVSVTTGMLGYIYAYAMYRSEQRVRVFLMFLILLPFFTSLLVRSFAWTVILRDTGIVDWALLRSGLVDQPVGILRTPFAVVVGMTQILLPFLVLPTYAAMSSFDPDLLSAARSMGGTWIRSFWLVFVPCSRTGLAAGMLLVFTLSIGYYITPTLLGGPGDQPVAALVNAQLASSLDWGLLGAMSTIIATAALIILALGWRLVGRILILDAW
jgi:ABC-type spermidine/putrescine transport system permease subunit I